MPLRRTLALATCVLAVCAPVLTSCGFDYATDRIYTPATGVNNREASVDVLGAVIVSAEEGSGIFVASFANNSTEEPATVEALEGVRPVPAHRRRLHPRSRCRPAAWSTSPTRAASR